MRAQNSGSQREQTEEAGSCAWGRRGWRLRLLGRGQDSWELKEEGLGDLDSLSPEGGGAKGWIPLILGSEFDERGFWGRELPGEQKQVIPRRWLL